MNQRQKVLLAELRGKRLFEVLVGPAGVHYDFTDSEKPAAKLQLSIFSDTKIRIHSETECLYGTLPYPPFASQDSLRRLLVDRKVTISAFDEVKSAARIVLDDEILLSLIPEIVSEGRSTSWSLHTHGRKMNGKFGLGFLVWPTSVERIRDYKAIKKAAKPK